MLLKVLVSMRRKRLLRFVSCPAEAHDASALACVDNLSSFLIRQVSWA